MRAIEEKIIDCLRKSDFLSDNYDYYGQKKILSPRDSVTLQKMQKRVYLHGNCIFTVDRENNIKFSFQGWQTYTTKSRINALLSVFYCPAGIYQKNGRLVFSSSAGEFPVDSDKIYTVENGKPVETESI